MSKDSKTVVFFFISTLMNEKSWAEWQPDFQIKFLGGAKPGNMKSSAPNFSANKLNEEILRKVIITYIAP